MSLYLCQIFYLSESFNSVNPGSLLYLSASFLVGAIRLTCVEGIISWPLGNRRFRGKPIRVRVKRSANRRQVTVSPLDRSIVKCLILETFYTRHSFHSLILLADTNNTLFVLITNLASVRLILLVST